MFSDQTGDLHFGYFSIVVSQNNKITSIELINEAFDQVFATIGGMTAFLYALISIVIGTYQGFSFENALNTKLYTQNKKAVGKKSLASMVYEDHDY